MATQLQISGLSKSFDTDEGRLPVVQNLTFDIKERDFVSLIGPSGCGKTTIFNIVAGLLPYDGGTMTFRGERVDGLRGRIGYMMQKDLLFPWRTVLQNCLLGVEMAPAKREGARDRALSWLRTLGMSDFANAYPSTLSGGQRQRVALIRTLVMDPDILLLDEPFSALDYQTRLHLEGVLMKAVEEAGKTVILITHDIDEAVALSKRVVVLSGRPARVKAIHDIDIASDNPVGSRADPKFHGYFKQLCSELDIQTA